jgi:predicted SAM-dependent methyltransferase
VRRLLLFFFSHRLLAIARWDIYFLLLRCKNLITLQRVRIVRFLKQRETPTFLNLGSGPRGLTDPNWINVDGFRDRNVHFLIDFRRPLPFPDGCFAGVFCEHVLEHFCREDGERLIRDVRRILADNGIVRLILPDAERIIKAYCEQPSDLVSHRNAGTLSAMEVVNMYFRQRYEHQFLYDWESLKQMLKSAGFHKIVRSTFGQTGLLQAIVLDDPKYAWESLYVEAQR